MGTQKYKKMLINVEQLSESNKAYIIGILDGLKCSRSQEKKYPTQKTAT